MARWIYEEARGKEATRQPLLTSASCTRRRATWARCEGWTVDLAPYKKDVVAVSVGELMDYFSSVSSVILLTVYRHVFPLPEEKRTNERRVAAGLGRARKEVEGVVTGDGVDGPVHELTVERYVRGCFPTSSLSPPPFRFSRAMDKERSHTGAASLSTTSNSDIPLYQPFPSLFLFLLILLYFLPLPAKSEFCAY